ncbi:metal ABC transporter solute-binding protein, Zn/Mn family [Nocardia alni]|uniref:metal ABC transporter solute-binding protein, Zn/Mn family n=1 Tax=Nocardia alni TaxID=2815723 RepID=UPI0020B263E1|nr:zinc ABC transporter substrate-binding protein [Nocardia alni]
MTKLDMAMRAAAALAIVGLAAGALAACSSNGTSGGSSGGKIVAVGAENEYADVISQIGGQYVTVSAIMSDPNTDPHTFESSASVSKQVQAASLVVQNGLGYDDFMSTILEAAPNASRKVVNVQKLRSLPDDTPNPHLWYDPATMPVVANALADDLSALQPDHASYFRKNEQTFLDALKPWTDALASFKRQYPNVPVAVTEPVADYLLDAAGTQDKTPMSMQTAVMNGTDPTPQDIATQTSLFTGKQVKVFLYNQQVTDELTTKFLAAAHAANIPVIGVYETMPTDGYNYQKWMSAEVQALQKAVADGTSTQKL